MVNFTCRRGNFRRFAEEKFIMKDSFKPVPRRDNVVVQEMNGEILIYDLGENKAFCLNETSALIWQACNGEKNVSEISREIGAKLGSPASEDLVWLALDQLKKENLIESKEDFQIDFNGISRRDVIKKVGLAAVVALPLVTSLVAPKAANAASPAAVTCSGGCTCNSASPGGGGTQCSTTGNNGVPCATAGCRCIQTANSSSAGTCQT